jgi:L-ascorbate metabolism protein UlaG (beta-lactamase superfamily)
MTGRTALRLTADASLPAVREAGLPGQGASLWWLGQAGFLIEIAGRRIVIDPYLSNSLGEKYAGTRFPHERMFPPPIEPGALQDIDWLLCTHAHSDHMDPGTIGPLIDANPQMQVLAPEAARQVALDRGVPGGRLHGVDAGQIIDIGGITVSAIPAAHEAFKFDDAGRHAFLGLLLEGGGIRVYHSGDTIPYPGLVESLEGRGVNLALLPVNGRDAERAANGVPGNLTLEEALALSETIGADVMLGHHIDMFSFNTIDRVGGEEILAAQQFAFPRLLVAPGVRYDISCSAAMGTRSNS